MKPGIKWIDIKRRKPCRFDANREGYVWVWPAYPSTECQVSNAHYMNVGRGSYPHIKKWAKIKGSAYDGNIPEPPI